MTSMTVDQQRAAIKFLEEHGWQWDNDKFHPRWSYECIYGWWLHPELRPRRTGDSQKLHYAAEIAFGLAGYDASELTVTPAWAMAYA